MYVFQHLTGKCNRAEQLFWQYIKNARKYPGNREIQNKILSHIVFYLFTEIPAL